jgi:hypothetical protein
MWLVQNLGFSTTNLDKTKEVLNRLNYEYKLFGISKLINTIFNLENILINPNEKFIIRGGTSLLSLLNNLDNLKDVNLNLNDEQLELSSIYINNLKDGLFYDQNNFDQNFYGNLDLPLINKNSQNLPVKENLALFFDEPMFVKPSRDQKAFNAGIIEPKITIKEFITSQLHENFYIDEVLIIAPIKKIYSEYRFFVVNNEVITGSQYKQGNNLVISNIVPNYILENAKEYAKLYNPHDVFTMDLADTQDGIKIVEYNCWNASGLYATDVPKIFNAVNDYQKNKLKNKRGNKCL